MDDLLDLNWTEPASSNVKQPIRQPLPQEKPRDAFADLLNTAPKPVDTSKLSLIEQQRLQQQSDRKASPWLTPTQTAASISSTTPKYSPSVSPAAPVSKSTTSIFETKQSTTSFEDLLNPFGNNSNKNLNQDRNMPLNQIRNQSSSTPTSENSSQWDFDLLDSKLTKSKDTTNANTPSLDPFEMDSLTQTVTSFASSPIIDNVSVADEEDDNPLGILAEPAKRQETPSPVEQEASKDRIKLDEDEEDSMIAHLVDMGFSLRESIFAIEATGGNDLQAAIDLLIQNAQVAQRQQQQSTNQRSAEHRSDLTQNERARMALFSNDSSPKQQQREPSRRQEVSESSNNDSLQHQTEKIVEQAQELGGFLYKNATSFLNKGREKVTKAVGDWQEQQRAQRLHNTQLEQGGPIKPKWMTDGEETVQVANSSSMEIFADDDDSDNEQDLEAERKKIQEMRRLQELKQREQASTAHKARQQHNLRKEKALINDEEVYVSPSRRRGNYTPSSSGRSTPRTTVSSSMTQQQPAQSATPKVNQRTRPIVNTTAVIMSRVNEARSQGNEKYKLGQFGEAEEAYSRAIEILPFGHDHQVLLSNNRAMARLKIGNYKKCVEDCDIAISLARQSGDGESNSEGVVIQWREQIKKSLYRKAEALENIEKYTDALATYDELIKLEGTNNLKLNQGMSRCRQALNPKAKRIATTNSSPKPPPPPPPPQQQNEDVISMFDPSAKATSSTTSTPTVLAAELDKSKAVAVMRAKAAAQEAEDAEKLEKTDDVNARLVAWKAGKEQNLRALLATLDTLLWPGAQWKGAEMSELINPKKCKIIYMKAIGKVHPDKLPSTVTVEQRMLASGIFASLNEAWDSFKNQNQM